MQPGSNKNLHMYETEPAYFVHLLFLTLSACARVTVLSVSFCLSVCLSVPSTLEPAAIRTLQLQSQQCLDATLQCLYCFDFLIKALERRHNYLYSY